MTQAADEAERAGGGAGAGSGWLDELVEQARRWTEVGWRDVLRREVKQLAHRTGVHFALQQVRGADVVILFFHKVLARSVGLWGEPALGVDELDRQLSYLARNYEVVSLSEVVRGIRGDGPFPHRGVVITFDDGYRNNLTRAAPLLRKHGLPATFFVTTGLVGTDEWMWGYQLEEMMFRYSMPQFGAASGDPVIRSLCGRGLSRYTTLVACVEYLKRVENARRLEVMQSLRSQLPVELDDDNRILSWDEVRELRSEGFEIGGHSVTHPVLPRLTPEQAEWEVSKCRETLHRELGTRPLLFSFPNGETTAHVTEAVSRHFEVAVTTSRGRCTPNSILLSLPRVFAPPTEAELAWDLTRQFLAAEPDSDYAGLGTAVPTDALDGPAADRLAG